MAKQPTSITTGIQISSRQREILSLLAEGKSNKEIADSLNIGYGTVKQHLFVIFRKLNVTNRAKAVIAAHQLMQNRPPQIYGEAQAMNGMTNLSLQKRKSQAWRLVSAVVISTPDGNFTSPEELDWRNTYLSNLRDVLKKYVDALDGQFLMLPYGGMLVWFGHPHTHLDDADRSVQFAQFAQQWSQYYLSQDYSLPPETLVQHAIGIGVSSKPEMSLDKNNELFASDTFRVAAILARNARVIKLPLADSLTAKLASTSVTWLAIQEKLPELAQLGDITAIDIVNKIPLDRSAPWGDFPFLDAVLLSVKTGMAEWIAVDSWPPAVATSVIDGLGNRAKSQGFKAIYLRSPSHQRRDQLLNSFTVQAENSVTEFDFQSSALISNVSAGERLGDFFASLAASSPIVIQAYGLRVLDSLRFVLGERGIERMAARSILVVAANLIESGSTKTDIRLLGSRPIDTPFSRLISIDSPDQEVLPEGIRVDLQAIFDDLSSSAQSIAMFAAQDGKQDFDAAVSFLKLTEKNSQAALQELTSVGLLTAGQAGGFKFRDQTTANAIQKLSIPRGH